jgi:hypothetical protein
MEVLVHITGTRTDELVDPETEFNQHRFRYNYIHRPEDCAGFCARLRAEALALQLEHTQAGAYACPQCGRPPESHDDFTCGMRFANDRWVFPSSVGEDDVLYTEEW